MTFIIKTNPLQATDVLIRDMGLVILASGGSETLLDFRDLEAARLSTDLITLSTDDAYGVGSSTLILNNGISDIPQSSVSTFVSGAGSGPHTLLSDMPDSLGTITDHDVRLVAKVQDAAPVVPAPFAGMFWYDTTSATPGNTLKTTLVTSTYTVIISDELIVAVSGAFNIYLPPATGTGRLLWIKYYGSGIVSVVANGTDTIDGDPKQDLLLGDSLMIDDYQTGSWAIL